MSNNDAPSDRDNKIKVIKTGRNRYKYNSTGYNDAKFTWVPLTLFYTQKF